MDYSNAFRMTIEVESKDVGRMALLLTTGTTEAPRGRCFMLTVDKPKLGGPVRKVLLTKAAYDVLSKHKFPIKKAYPTDNRRKYADAD